MYIYERLGISYTHPLIAEHLVVGDFVVQKQNQYSFNQTLMDQTFEQSINRDSKTREEQIGFSNNTNTVYHWTLSFKEHAKISRNYTERSGKAEGCHKKKKI